MAIMKTLGNLLRQALDVPLLGPLGFLVVEPGQHMLLVQALELLRLARDVGQDLRDLVGDVGPPRRQQVHFYHGVAVVVVVGRAGGEEAAPVVVGVEEDRGARRCRAAAEAVGRRRAVGAGIFVAVGGMVGVGLAVGEVAGEVRGLEGGLSCWGCSELGHTGWFCLATWRTPVKEV